jgi:hypothetical protein
MAIETFSANSGQALPNNPCSCLARVQWKVAVISGSVGKVLTRLTNCLQTDFLRVDSVGENMADNAFAGMRPARISSFAGNGPEELTNPFTLLLVEALA